MTDINTPLVFVVCNDYGELALAMYLLEQQPFAQNVTLMLPPQLYGKNPDVLPGRTLSYHSLEDVQAQMKGDTGGILGLFSGYLLPNHRLCELDQLGALLQWAGDNGWNSFTSDPFLGLLDSVDPADLVTLKAPAWHIIWYLAAKKEKKRLSQLLTETHTLLGELLHVYPVGDSPNEMEQGFAKRLHVRNDALVSLSETQAKDTDGPSRWLFVLGDQDYTVQLGKYGQFSRRFLNLLMAKLHETLEAGRLPTLVAPSKVIELVHKRSPAADSIELLSHCDYRTFQSLLTDAEYVFYWNAVSFTCIQRTLTDKPWFTFDDGHLLRGMNTDYNRRITQWFYRDAEPPRLDIRKELTTEGLLRARQNYLRSARLIRDGLLRTHDSTALLDAWNPLARKTVTEIFDVLIELGNVVSAAQLDGNTVVDAGLLPHPKGVIEDAVENLLKRDIGEQLEFVRSAVMTLPFFQPGVGDGRYTLDSPGPDGAPWRATVRAELYSLENHLLKPLAPETETEPPPGKKALDMVIELGKVVAAAQLDGNTVIDAGLLPYAKDDIKTAVADLLEQDIGDEADFVRSAVMTLPFFQPGVGDGRYTLDSPGPDGAPWRATVRAELYSLENHLLKPLAPETETEPAPGKKTLDMVIELGKVVAAAQLDGNTVIDAGLLPYAKDDIKAAVADLLEQDIGDEAEFVRSAVMTLAFFQPGVGNNRHTLDSPGPNDKPWRATVQAELEQIKTSLLNPRAQKTVAEIFDVVKELGQVVSAVQLDGNTVVDEGLLAHPKGDIKKAVANLLERDIGDEAEFVRSAVMTLAFFQPGVGNNRHTLDSPGPDGQPWRDTVQAEQYEIKTSLLD